MLTPTVQLYGKTMNFNGAHLQSGHQGSISAPSGRHPLPNFQETAARCIFASGVEISLKLMFNRVEYSPRIQIWTDFMLTWLKKLD
jgi:hypothetical protein